MKIQARNAYAFIGHTKVLGYLSGKHEAEELRGMAYCVEGEEVYAKLLRIENKAHRMAELSCNEGMTEEEEAKHDERFTKQVQQLLPRLFPNSKETGFFLNGDPRGYTLKCKSEYAKELEAVIGNAVYQDWGGYFILAPEF